MCGFAWDRPYSLKRVPPRVVPATTATLPAASMRVVLISSVVRASQLFWNQPQQSRAQRPFVTLAIEASDRPWIALWSCIVVDLVVLVPIIVVPLRRAASLAVAWRAYLCPRPEPPNRLHLTTHPASSSSPVLACRWPTFLNLPSRSRNLPYASANHQRRAHSGTKHPGCQLGLPMEGCSIPIEVHVPNHQSSDD